MGRTMYRSSGCSGCLMVSTASVTMSVSCSARWGASLVIKLVRLTQRSSCSGCRRGQRAQRAQERAADGRRRTGRTHKASGMLRQPA